MSNKTKMKFSILLMLSLIIVLAGCSNSNNNAGAPSNTTGEAPTQTEVTSSRIDQIKKSGKLVIATGDYYPFEYLDAATKELIGYDIDLGEKIAEKLGVEVEWKGMQFTAITPTIQNGQADLAIAAMYITDDRKKTVDMSDVYLATGMSLVKRGDDSSINSLDDLNGKKVGVKSGATSEAAAKELVAKGMDIEIVSYKDTTDYLLDLKLGRVDAAINDYLNQIGYNQQHAEAGLAIVGEPFTEAGLGIAMKKGDTELLALVNEVIAELEESGEAQAIYDKWLKQE